MTRGEGQHGTADFYGASALRHRAAPSSLGEVEALARRARRGSRWARRELLVSLGSIAETVSAKYVGVGAYRGLERDDLRQEAIRAMLEGVDNWDPQKATFRTHAFNVARWAILKQLNSGHLVSVPRNLAQVVTTGRWTGGYADMSDWAKEAAVQATKPEIPFAPANDDELLLGLDPSCEEPGYEEFVDRATLERMFARARLTDYQEEAVRVRFGFSDKTVGDLARERGVSEQGVRKAAERALKYLKVRNDAKTGGRRGAATRGGGLRERRKGGK